MSRETAAALAEWLASLPNVRNAAAQEYRLKIGGREAALFGARYDQVRTRVATEAAVKAGVAAAGDEYRTTTVALLGEPPRELLARQGRGDGTFSSWVVRRPGDGGSWYVAFYTERYHPSYSPCGPMFCLNRWNHEEPWMGGMHDGAPRPPKEAMLTVAATFHGGKWAAGDAAFPTTPAQDAETACDTTSASPAPPAAATLAATTASGSPVFSSLTT